MADYIGRIFCSANLACRKPSARYFQRIVTQLRCPPSEIVMIGDRLQGDVQGSLASGLGAVWFSPAHLDGPVAIPVIHHWDELIMSE